MNGRKVTINDADNTRYLVKIDKSSNDLKRIKAHVQDTLRNKRSDGWRVASKKDGDQMLLEITGPENQNELRKALPFNDGVKGSKINYEISTYEDTEPHNGFIGQESNEVSDPKFQAWLDDILRENEMLRKQNDELSDGFESLEELNKMYVAQSSLKIKNAEFEVGDLVERPSKDLLEALYSTEEEFIAGRTGLEVDKVDAYSGKNVLELRKAIEDLKQLSEEGLVNVDAVIGALNQELQKELSDGFESSDDIVNKVLSQKKIYENVKENANLMELQIQKSVYDLDSDIDFLLSDTSDNVELYVPIGGETGALSVYMASLFADSLRDSELESDDYQVRQEIFSGGAGILSIGFEHETGVKTEQLEDLVKDVMASEGLEGIDYNIHSYKELREDESVLSYDEFRQLLESTPGLGSKSAESISEYLQAEGYADPVEGYIKNPVTLQEEIPMFGSERYMKGLEALEEL